MQRMKGKKPLNLIISRVFNVMEARGIEPLSENSETEPSPSAVYLCYFPLPVRVNAPRLR